MNAQPSREELERYLHLLEYELALQEARDDLVRFTEITMPLSNRPDDVFESKYQAAKHHYLMADLAMQVEMGARQKVIINTAPRHGKTEICTKHFAAWYSARNPDKDVIVATYNEKFAHDFGKEVRDIINSRRFQQIFPDYYLVRESNEHCTNMEGGDLFFLGRRSTTTGRGGDLIIVDDPTKDAEEVSFSTFRDKCWTWFVKTLLTRRHTDQASIMISQTRWHEDDIVGRIIDPENPVYSPKLAKGFDVINLPAIAQADDVLGRDIGEALWPQRFGLHYLEEMQDADSVSFSALYQCDPTPEEGVFYHIDELTEYSSSELPEKLTIYVVSDHAVATKNINDPTCMVPFGICENNNAWILPGVIWRRMNTLQAVEHMITLITDIKPVFWYAEKGHISKSIGPFLRKAMAEAEVYCPIIEEQPVGDKQQRAQSGRARSAQGRIKYPKDAPWWPKARTELLKFPNARHDDFVDCISMIGLKLASQTSPGRNVSTKKKDPKSYGAMLDYFKKQDHANRAARARKGW